jgi:hypothetical protein
VRGHARRHTEVARECQSQCFPNRGRVSRVRAQLRVRNEIKQFDEQPENAATRSGVHLRLGHQKNWISDAYKNMSMRGRRTPLISS